MLEDAGFRVERPARPLCCGRPLYDYGMLDRAKRYLERSARCAPRRYPRRTPIVALEPSCAAVFRDELTGLLPDAATRGC